MEGKSLKAFVLGGGNDQVPLFELLRNRGVRTVLVDYLDDPPARQLADKHCQVSAMDVAAVRDLARTESPNIILSAGNDGAVPVLAQVSEELGLRNNISCATARMATNKLEMKRLFASAGVATNRWCIVERSHFSNQIERDIAFPIVAKPVRGWGGKGVVRIDHPDDLGVALGRLFELTGCETALLEEFRQGLELSIDCYAAGGVAKVLACTWLVQVPNNGTGFAFHRSLCPAPIGASLQAEVEATAQRIATSFGIAEGPFFIQAIACAGRLYVLEMGARPAGGWKHRFVEAASGFDPLRAYVDWLLGKPADVDVHEPSGVLGMNHVYARPGVLQRIAQDRTLIAEGLVEYFVQAKRIGAQLQGLISSKERVLSFMVRGRDLEELEAKVLRIVERLELLDPAGQPLMRKEPYRYSLESILDTMTQCNTSVCPDCS